MPLQKLLRRGSRGQDVAELQTLLSDLYPLSYPGWGDTFLDTDGKFGPLTDGWVRAVQTQAKIKVDGIVGPNTWSAIERLQGQKYKTAPVVKPQAAPKKPEKKVPRPLIVYIHDAHIYDAGQTFGRHQARDAKGDVVHVRVSNGYSTEKLLDDVVKKVGEDALELLILNSHGNSRQTNIGDVFSTGSWGAFSKLQPLFHKAGFKLGIEIHSCCFASAVSVGPKDYGAFAEFWIECLDGAENLTYIATDGAWGDNKRWHDENLRERWTPIKVALGQGTEAMLAMAKACGAPVKAGFNYQRRDKEGRFEGMWACARPNNTVTLHPPTTPPASIR